MKFPNESVEYRKARLEVKEKEIALRRAAEAAAVARRALPLGGKIPEDYVFQGLRPDGTPGPVKLSELFGKNQTLALYSYMFGPEAEKPCNMCTGMLDALNGVEEHVRQRVSLFAVARSPLDRLLKWKEERGWKRLPLLSSGANNYNRDYHGTDAKGQDDTMMNVFRKTPDGIFHFWGSELSEGPSDPGQDHRSGDMLNPTFSLFDMTPEGRGDFYTKLVYPK